MSANNFYFAKEIDGKWYGWCENAETWKEYGEPVQVSLSTATQAETLSELESKLDERWWYCEYGLTTQPYLPKDGTPIEVIE
jgi:hypothetical protein